ncbi:cd7 antigen-like [Xiphias gladius]|uniref:cd7 antigen-like n=1 Tax=Xiphias gladius TaxID=8245 RepID=UPI001A99B4BF|nr:cd7 antigen-like [Xiphias gladius]
MNLAGILIFIQLFQAHAELIFRRLTEDQSLELSCSFQQDLSSPTGLHLYHRSAQSQTTLLSMAEDGKLRVDPEHRARLHLRGGLDSRQVNVTISRLQHGDTGLYMWELSYGEEDSPELILCAQKAFLQVEGAGRPFQCSRHYLPVLLTVFAAAGLVVLSLSWLAREMCVKVRHHHRGQPPVPIYEEMTRKQQSAGIPQNNLEAPTHLEEDNSPVYANPNIRKPQENYYACPRQLALRA